MHEFDIQGDYGRGWETVCAASTAAEARQRLREYRENEPHYAHRIKRRRTRPRCMYNHEHNGRDCMYHD